MTPKKWDNFFFLWWDLYFTKYKYGGITISLYLPIKGQQRSSWSLLGTFTCWTCLKHLVNMAIKWKCISICWPSPPSVLDKVLNEDHEDLCRPLIVTYKLAINRQYLHLVKYRSHRGKKLSRGREWLQKMGHFFSIVRLIYHELQGRYGYNQPVFINLGSAEVFMFFWSGLSLIELV